MPVTGLSQISLLNIPGKTIQAAFDIESNDAFALTTSLFPIGAMIGALFLAPWLANKYGRRMFFIMSSPAFILGGLLMFISGYTYSHGGGDVSLTLLVIGRFLCGVGVGSGSVVTPMYLSEVSPIRLRGMFGALTQFCITGGILLVELISAAMKDSWPWLLLLSAVMGVLQLVGAWFILPSPAFLATRGKRAEAIDVVCRLHNVSKRSAEMAVDALETPGSKTPTPSGARPSILDLARSPVYWKPLLLCMLLMLLQQFSGINAVFFYSNNFFEGIATGTQQEKDNLAFTGSVVLAAINVAATGLAVAVVERAGRRPLLLISTFGMAIVTIALTIVLSVASADPSSAIGFVEIALLSLFVIFFELGLGPIPWILGAELFPEQQRATAMSAAAAVNWVCTFLIAQFFKSIQLAIGQLCFVPFAVALVLGSAYLFFVLPETKGKVSGEILRDMGLPVDGDLLGGGADVESDWDDSLLKVEAGHYASKSVNPADRSFGGDDADTEGGSEMYYGGN
jgi:MFS transporter, SP family, solute carrier family 2 (facilitated glucose transporter), member 3